MLDLAKIIPAVAGEMSITGFEDRAAPALSAFAKDFDDVRTDAVGNVILCRRAAKAGAPRFLVDTHFDEIGMLVSEIAENGFLRIAPVGGLDTRTLPSAQVKVYGKREIVGVITSTPPHLRRADDAKIRPKTEDLFVDTGLSDEEIQANVRVGTPVGFYPRYKMLGNRLVGKGLDNKAPAAVALAALAAVPREELAFDVFLLLSVHEETDDAGGVAVGGFETEPDMAFVLDVNIGTAPGTKKSESVELGKGISLCRSAVTDRTLTAMTEAMCDREGIAWQRCVEAASTGTNTGALHLVRSGIPVVDVGLPLRAMHTYVEMIDTDDAESLAELLRAAVCDKDLARECVRK